ncbi:putative transcriptional regulatory protein pdtaR [compost metagenome]|uniref:Putative transcriptional regulatory protein pdtaR n=1 Tax=Achromobacter agilis TaxID=1353888 RepID=A0A446CY39_9BURK|nr:ANTAR domain-containing protein [Achromobacter agilis]SSW72763.1 putative transcriptional regulatory protein pdtaR [Achromobacter agilis]
MLKVMLLNDGEGRAASLRQTLAAAGLHVVAEVAPGTDLAAAIARAAPDVVLIDSDAPGRDTLENVCVASEHSDRPVVMFTDNGNRETIRVALRAGVAAYVVGDVPAERIEPLLTVAIERFAMEKSRREELREAQLRLADRRWVEQAKGILMRSRSIPEDEAHGLLRQRAMQSQKRLGEVAREVVELSQWLGKSS